MAGYDSGPGYKARLGVGGPIGDSDTLKFQLSGSYLDTDGYIDNPFLGEEADPFKDVSGRVKLLWEPSEHVPRDFRVSYSQVDTQALYFNITEQRRTTRACRCGSTTRGENERDLYERVAEARLRHRRRHADLDHRLRHARGAADRRPVRLPADPGIGRCSSSSAPTRRSTSGSTSRPSARRSASRRRPRTGCAGSSAPT